MPHGKTRLVWICKHQDNHDVCWTWTQVSVLAWPSLESCLATYCWMELSFRKIALNLNISCSTAQTTFKLFKQTGEVSPCGQPSRKETRCLSDADEIYIVGLVLENPSMHLQELCQKIYHVGKSQHPLCVDCLQGMGSPGKRYRK